MRPHAAHSYPALPVTVMPGGMEDGKHNDANTTMVSSRAMKKMR